MRLRGISSRLARRLGVNQETVNKLIKEFIFETVSVLETEEPVSLDGLGEFYFSYRDYDHRLAGKPVDDSINYENMKFRRIMFRPTGYVKELLNCKVRGIGIRSSKSTELRKNKLVASEIPKLREAVNAAGIDMQVKLRRMTGDVTLAEVASSLTHVIEEMPEDL